MDTSSAALAHFTQDTRLLRLSTPLGADALLVERLEGKEGLSEGFRFDLDLLSTDAHLDLEVLIGQPVLLEILTQHSRSSLRSLHGHCTAFARLSSDGGFARYRLTLEPWTAFLRHRRDSFLWQDKSVPEIVEEIFRDYQGQGSLLPAWRFELADAGRYRPRELCTRFEESDWDFIERLLADEGLFYWFEHEGNRDEGSLGKHTLVIADHNGAFKPNTQDTIRYHRASAVEKNDSITQWQAKRQWMSNAIALSSWNERQVGIIGAELQTAHDNGELPELRIADHPGQRHFDSRAQAEAAARRQLEALEARNKIYHGQGTVRTLAPGTTFVLDAHAVHDRDRQQNGDAAATFAVIGVEHHARNNLDSDARTLTGSGFANSSAAPAEHEAALYSNRFTALRADIPWRPLAVDRRGALLHPKPTVAGLHSGIVVGLDGADLHTERDHCIKVQMHWQRGARSHSRRDHPQGNDNAPAHAGASAWMRVATLAAGANWGSNFLPRIGQEVAISYLDGDIDRPVVIGSLYNGQGEEDAQGNLRGQGAGAATGNAPAWFAGSSGAHAHNAILSGFKTQEIGNSRDGQGGYNALIFDDTAAQLGARLQTTKTQAQLNLGHIKRQQDNARKQSHGHGAELTTEAWGALRAAQGMLITVDARPNAGSAHMDASEALAQLRQAHALQQTLADTARKHNAFAGKTLDQERHEHPDKVLHRPVDSLAQIDTGIGTSEGGGAGDVPAFGRPDLVVSAPGGVALLTPQDAHATASLITATGGIDVSATAARNFAVAVRSGITLFTYGDAKAGRGQHGDKGIKLHAAQGKFELQAQSAELKAAADKDVHVTSTQAKVEAAAKEHVLLTTGGACIRIAGGNIEIHAPGVVEFKAAMKVVEGAASLKRVLPDLPKSALYAARFKVLDKESNAPLPGKLYRTERENGTASFGMTDEDGNTHETLTPHPENVKIVLDRNEKFHRMSVTEDDINDWFNGEKS
jgi:type VI secretion system VgrG family protein